MKPQKKKNLKNIGLGLRSTHYSLGNDRTFTPNLFRM